MYQNHEVNVNVNDHFEKSAGQTVTENSGLDKYLKDVSKQSAMYLGVTGLTAVSSMPLMYAIPSAILPIVISGGVYSIYSVYKLGALPILNPDRKYYANSMHIGFGLTIT
jgi:hypothetical protein